MTLTTIWPMDFRVFKAEGFACSEGWFASQIKQPGHRQRERQQMGLPFVFCTFAPSVSETFRLISPGMCSAGRPQKEFADGDRRRS
jgi:hypothetical protein